MLSRNECAELTGCAADYTPPQMETTGVPAEPLGAVIDLEVSLPQFFVPSAGARGLQFELQMDVPVAGAGQHEARYVISGATAAGGLEVEILDLSGGGTTLTVTGDSWITGRIGPLQVDSVPFEMFLDGVPDAGGRFVSGQSWESQTGQPGLFQGWSRHRFLLTITDFSFAGRLAEVSLVKESEIRVRGNLGQVSSDAVLRSTARSLFVVNRLSFDNVQRLDPEQEFGTTWQSGTGTGSNPHDTLRVDDERLYITRYEPPFNDVAVADLETGAITSSIPLAALATNPDGTPRADRIVRAGDLVFVALQDIDRSFSRYEEGKLAVIDPSRDEVVGVIPLGGKNPVALAPLVDGAGQTRLFVALAGIFPGLRPQELSGGVVEVDTTNLALIRVVLDDDDAGGNISALALASEELGYIVVSTEDFRNRVIAFRPDSGEILRTVFESMDLIAGIEVDTGGILAVPDRTFTSPGLCLFRIAADPYAPEDPIGCGRLDLMPFTV